MENHVTCSETGNHEDKWMPNTLYNYIRLTYASDHIMILSNRNILRLEHRFHRICSKSRFIVKLHTIGMILLEYFKFLKMVNGGVCWNMAFLVNYHNINDP